MTKDMTEHVNNLVDNLINKKYEDTLEEHYLKCWQTLGVMCVHVVNTKPTIESIVNSSKSRNELLEDIMDTEIKLGDKIIEELGNE